MVGPNLPFGGLACGLVLGPLPSIWKVDIGCHSTRDTSVCDALEDLALSKWVIGSHKFLRQ